MMSNDKNLTPQLRFPEFKNSGEWEEKKLGEISSIVKEKLGKNNYTLLSITAGHGLVSQLEKFGKEIAGSSYENYIVIHKNDFAYNKSATKDYQSGYVALLKTYDVAAVPNSIFLCFRIDETILNVFFLEQLFKFNYHDKYLRKLIQIGARAHGSLNISNKDFFSIPIPVPPLKEQKKIAGFLSSVDELLEQEKIKLENLKEYKKGLLQNLFPKENQKVPDLRFPEFKNSGDWEEKKIKDILDYEQPTKYIVENDNYSMTGTPVLTANKSFILGYTNETTGIYNNLPVIIFDDFTTDKKYVAFPFKIKSSAIKILSAKKDDNIKFIYELMTLIHFNPQEHKRYYIGTYQNIDVLVPPLKEQQKIAEFLSSVDELIIAQVRKILLLQEYKKGLLQKLFPQGDI